MLSFGLAKRGLKLAAAGMFACTIAFTAVSSFTYENVSGVSVSQPDIDKHSYFDDWYAVAPTTSGIVRLDDGGYMTFKIREWYNSEEPYIVEYYDSSFNLVSIKEIDEELPYFGCFYADSNYYYVFTGQENPKESADVECFRLTKYDKDWKRLGSCGFYNCNTIGPFIFGAADMVSYGDRMVIRVSRQMYKSTDGLNHQSNATFLADTSTMKPIAYEGQTCGHCFNSYVKIDGNRLIAADQGDASPRAMQIVSYQGDITTYKNFNAKHDYYYPLEFGGSYENDRNYTGACLGGLEVSSTSYIIVGNSADQNNFSSDIDEDYDDTACGRNIFVSTVNKSSGECKTTWLTTNATRTSGYYNPYIVKVNDNSFCVIWSKTGIENTVYYAFIDGNGNLQGSILSGSGFITKCQPVLSGNRIIWFGDEINNMYQWRWDDFEYRTFLYSINVSDKSFSSKGLFETDVTCSKHGTATLSRLKASPGTDITVNVKPDDGYELDLITVNGTKIEGTGFKMPNDFADVKVFFKKEGAPSIGDTVTVDDLIYTVMNSDTDGYGTVAVSGVANQTESVIIPNTVVINECTYTVNRIAAQAFMKDTTVKTVVIGANVVVIDAKAFYGCSYLVKVSGGAKVVTIGQTAFGGCPRLKVFSIGSPVLKKISPYAFYGDKSLKTIYIQKTTKLTKAGVKKSLKGSKVKTVKVKKAKVKKYKKYFTKKNCGRKVKVKK